MHQRTDDPELLDDGKILLEQSKSGLDFFKTLTGFASASILLVMNFLPKEISNIDGDVKLLIMLSLLCFTLCVGLGIFAMRKVINSFGESAGFGYYTMSMFVIFLGGYILLLFAIASFIDFNFWGYIDYTWDCFFNY